MKTQIKLPIALIAAASLWLFADLQEAISLSQATYTGRVSAIVSLSSAGGQSGITITGPSIGARVTSTGGGTSDFAEIVDFGELSLGTGEPIVVNIGLMMRGNSTYKLNAANFNFIATNLQYKDIDVGPSGDKGSFITIQAGSPTPTGVRSNPQGSTVSGLFQAGVFLDEITQGQVDAQSTAITSGDSPSLGGTINSTDNAVLVPLRISVPTGLAIGPTSDAAKGIFQITLQVGIFPGG
jgi:hypothetical protein